LDYNVGIRHRLAANMLCILSRDLHLAILSVVHRETGKLFWTVRCHSFNR